LELQANNFGGLLLVPQKELAKHFEMQLKSLMRSSKMGRFEGLARANYVDFTLKIITEKLVDVFPLIIITWSSDPTPIPTDKILVEVV